MREKKNSQELFEVDIVENADALISCLTYVRGVHTPRASEKTKKLKISIRTARIRPIPRVR